MVQHPFRELLLLLGDGGGGDDVAAFAVLSWEGGGKRWNGEGGVRAWVSTLCSPSTSRTVGFALLVVVADKELMVGESSLASLASLAAASASSSAIRSSSRWMSASFSSTEMGLPSASELRSSASFSYGCVRGWMSEGERDSDSEQSDTASRTNTRTNTRTDTRNTGKHLPLHRVARPTWFGGLRRWYRRWWW